MAKQTRRSFVQYATATGLLLGAGGIAGAATTENIYDEFEGTLAPGEGDTHGPYSLSEGDDVSIIVYWQPDDEGPLYVEMSSSDSSETLRDRADGGWENVGFRIPDDSDDWTLRIWSSNTNEETVDYEGSIESG